MMQQNLRDERVECFASQLQPETYVYEYTARATTPGTNDSMQLFVHPACLTKCLGRFIVPPAKIEEMYDPDIYGQSSSHVLLVE